MAWNVCFFFFYGNTPNYRIWMQQFFSIFNYFSWLLDEFLWNVRSCHIIFCTTYSYKDWQSFVTYYVLILLPTTGLRIFIQIHIFANTVEGIGPRQKFNLLIKHYKEYTLNILYVFTYVTCLFISLNFSRLHKNPQFTDRIIRIL